MAEKAKNFKIDWSSRSRFRGPGEGSLGEMLLTLRNRFAPKAEGISISYVDDRGMRKLNREHRGINQTTDVLSFPSEVEKGAFPHLGDIVISLQTAEKMAKKLGISRRRFTETLVIHGFLHLCGFDHEMDKGEMMKLQNELEAELLGDEPVEMQGKRGRRPGSKVKTLRTGERVVVTGRAAETLARKEAERAQAIKDREKARKEKEKAREKKKKETGKVKVAKKVTTRRTKAVKPVDGVKRGPGRPRKNPLATPDAAPAKRQVRRKKPTVRRSGVIG